MKDHYISVNQDIYSTYIVAKYLDTATVRTGENFHNTNLPSGMIFNKSDASISDEKIEKLTREFNIHYRACIGSLIYFLSTRVELSFAVHKLSKFSANPGKVHSKKLVHILSYIRDNNILVLKYYADINEAPENQLVGFLILVSKIVQTLAEL